VAVKCAGITATPARVIEFGLKEMYRSPNGSALSSSPAHCIRTTVRMRPLTTPIFLPLSSQRCANIPRLVRSWDHPIVVARHAHADQYRATDALTHPSGGTLTMTFTPADGSPPETREVANLKGAGVSLAMYNTDASITDFAKISFEYAKQHGLPLFLATKNTILKVYDGKFVSKFEEIAAEYPDVEYEHRLIDDFVAGMIKSSGGYGTYCSRIFFVPFGRLAVSHSSNYASLRSLRYPHCRAPSQLSH
jgi:isocitrate dehydrogenase